MAGADDRLEEMVNHFVKKRDSARRWNQVDGGRRNELASQAADDNYADAVKIQMASKSDVQDMLKEKMAHTSHWRDQFNEWGGWDNEYAAQVHAAAYGYYQAAAHDLQELQKVLGSELDTVAMTLIPIVEINGGMPDGHYSEKKVIKTGYSSTFKSSADATAIMSRAEVYIKILTGITKHSSLNVDVTSAFNSTIASTSAETSHEKEFSLSMKDPCYIYVASCSIVTKDGNKHTFNSDAFVQSSMKLLNTKYSVRV